MRSDCKHFQTRSYPSGDTVRKCALDLAPEAPWRCPETCESYERRLADVNWRHGTLITPPTPEEPESVGEDDSVAKLLDEAENIVNSVADQVKEEIPLPSKPKRKGIFRRLWPFRS